MNELNKISRFWIESKELSKNSQRFYELELVRFTAWMDLKNHNLTSLTASLMNEYLQCLKLDPEDSRSLFYIRRKKGLSESSIEQTRRILNAFFEWCLRNGYVLRNPFWVELDSSHKAMNKKTVITLVPSLPKKIKHLLFTKIKFDDENNLRVATIAHLAFWVGASREEIAQLTVGHFVYGHSASYISLPSDKGRAVTKVLLPKQSGFAIQKYLNCRRERYSINSDTPLVSSIKSGEFMTGWSIRHTLRNWQKEKGRDQLTPIVGPRQLRQAFQDFAITREIPERVIGEHFRVKNLSLPMVKSLDDYPIRLYKAVTIALSG